MIDRPLSRPVLPTRLSVRLAPVAAFVAVLLIAVLPVSAATLSAELQFDDGSERKQRGPMAAFAPSGHGLVVWEESYTGLMARPIDADGAPLADPRLLIANDEVPVPFAGRVTEHVRPRALFLDDEQVLVVWTRERVNLRVDFFIEHRRTVEQDVLAQRFDRLGNPVTRPYLLSEGRDGFQSGVTLSMLPDGRTLAAWSLRQASERPDGIVGRLLNRNGHPAAPSFRIAEADRPGESPAVAGNGRQLLVTWDACCDRGGDRAIQARLLDYDGSVVSANGPVFQVNGTEAGGQSHPVAVTEAEEGYLLAWHGPTGQVDDEGLPIRRIYGQVVGRDGSLRGPELLLSNGPGRAHDAPALAVADDGSRLLVWRWFRKYQPSGLAYAEIGPRGGSADAEPLNEQRILEQPASLSTAPDGRVLATWVGVHDRERVVAGRFVASGE